MFLKGALKKQSYLRRLNASSTLTGTRAFSVKDLQAFNQGDQEQLRNEAKQIHKEFSH